MTQNPPRKIPLRHVPDGQRFVFADCGTIYVSRGNGWYHKRPGDGGLWCDRSDDSVIIPSIPNWALELIQALQDCRAAIALGSVWAPDVAAMSIGYTDGMVRLCDDTGCYDFRQGSQGVVCTSHGDICRALEHVAHCYPRYIGYIA